MFFGFFWLWYLNCGTFFSVCLIVYSNAFSDNVIIQELFSKIQLQEVTESQKNLSLRSFGVFGTERFDSIDEWLKEFRRLLFDYLISLHMETRSLIKLHLLEWVCFDSFFARYRWLFDFWKEPWLENVPSNQINTFGEETKNSQNHRIIASQEFHFVFSFSYSTPSSYVNFS